MARKNAEAPVTRRLFFTGFRRRAQGRIGGDVIAAAVLGHAERQQVPLPAIPEPRGFATQGERCFEFRLVGGRHDAARFGGAVRRGGIVGALCGGEDALAATKSLSYYGTNDSLGCRKTSVETLLNRSLR